MMMIIFDGFNREKKFTSITIKTWKELPIIGTILI